MKTFKLSDHPHRRQNILTGEWIIVSPHRAKRPWQGKIEKPIKEIRPQYDENCYLCPGNIRATGERNPAYEHTFAFNNDYSSLQLDLPDGELNKENLLIAKSERGICRVVCFSPRHDLTLAEMDIDDIRKVVDVWINEYETLGNMPGINYVLIFENKGEIMGCSNPHPHCQIWAQQTIPVEPSKETQRMLNYFHSCGNTLLGDYLQLEQKAAERIIIENEYFSVLVPFWATWPYETIIISRRAFPNLTAMVEEERRAFAEILKRLTVRYDNLFKTSFPYSAGIHQSPTDGEEHHEWHFHAHFYPPLLRSATIKKFMVGYEMLGNPQRDITAELAATQLRELSDAHYLNRMS